MPLRGGMLLCIDIGALELEVDQDLDYREIPVKVNGDNVTIEKLLEWKFYKFGTAIVSANKEVNGVSVSYNYYVIFDIRRRVVIYITDNIDHLKEKVKGK